MNTTTNQEMRVTFGGYTVYTGSLRKGQMILAQANREMETGDVDAWYYAGCPIGRAYKKWKEQPNDRDH